MKAGFRALNRFGLGARPGDPRRVDDPRGWLHAQLDGGPPLLPAPPAASPAAIGDAIRALQVARPDPRERQQARRRLLEIAAAEAQAALTARVVSARPFVERLVAFWSNHLCVSIAKAQVAPLAGSYEREAIRPHVLGRFEELVLASARHPAMLLYLDNVQSIGPGAPAARAAPRNAGPRRGLNENHARELLELHTLGVDGGYTQQDVEALARMLTGWTIDGRGGPAARAAQRAMPRAGRGRFGRGPAPAQAEPSGPIAFAFRDALHEPGAKTLLGVRYTEDGAAEGERAIRALCRHRSTALRVATRLVTHFVSDDPPPGAVDRVARRFRDSDGDLLAVARALVDEPDAWREEHRKFRTPQDWLVAVLRGSGATEVPSRLAGTLRQLRQPLWAPPSPRGFADTLQEWADPDALLNRAELARTIGRLSASTLEPSSILDAIDLAAADPLRALVADRSIAPAERVALAIAAPAFQWR